MDHVLVPLDESISAETALEEAFALFPDAKVTVLHVAEVTEPTGRDGKSATEVTIDEGRAICERAAEIADARGRTLETDLIEGNAEKTIVRYAEEHDIDHIVMGSTGSSGLSRVLLGSVAESVIREAPCSVTVVRSA